MENGNNVSNYDDPSDALPPVRVDHEFKNWANIHQCRPGQFYEPTTLDQIRAVVAQAAEDDTRVKVVGSGHSPNDSALCSDVMISLRHFNKILVVDREKCVVKVQAGVTLSQLHDVLDAHGMAFPNLGSISDQTIAGAICTGTHGTGIGYGILATQMLEIQVVTATGEVIVASKRKHPDIFAACLCSLGCIGIITGVVFRCRPAFDLRVTESPARLDDVLANVESRVGSAPHYKFLWYPHTDRVLEWRASPLPPHEHRPRRSPLFLGIPEKLQALQHFLLFKLFGYYFLEFVLYIALYIPLLIPMINRVWYAALFSWKRTRVDRSDRIFNFDCLFRQHVLEYAIPADRVGEAMEALRQLVKRDRRYVHFPVEVRFVSGDDIWLSPAYGRPTCYIGVIMYKPYNRTPSGTAEYFSRFEREMVQLGGRPHWAKEFKMVEADFAEMYPRWSDFRSIRDRLDPHGMFANDWVHRVVIGDSLGDEVPHTSYTQLKH